AKTACDCSICSAISSTASIFCSLFMSLLIRTFGRRHGLPEVLGGANIQDVRPRPALPPEDRE
ncbi:MAG: hypothetical protein NWP31_03575, partial [Solirubrobacteraceae bacterium]|nr:hypothetical protein [Solirubrobacteraceae bacterium]